MATPADGLAEGDLEGILVGMLLIEGLKLTEGEAEGLLERDG